MNIFLEQMAASQSPFWNHGNRQVAANHSPIEAKSQASPFIGLMQEPKQVTPNSPHAPVRPMSRSWQDDLGSSWERPLSPKIEHPAAESKPTSSDQSGPQNDDKDRDPSPLYPRGESTTSERGESASQNNKSPTKPEELNSLEEQQVEYSTQDDSSVEQEEVLSLPNSHSSKEEDHSLPNSHSSKEEDQQKEPIFYLLTGQLQHLNPQSIPSLVLNNEFLQSAMAESSPESFLQQTQTASAWLQQLGISPEKQAAILQQSDIFAEQNITGYQLFREMGFDPQTIAQELGQIQDKLSTDGLTPLMARAAALQKQPRSEEISVHQPEAITESALVVEAAPKEKHGPTVAKEDPFRMMEQQWDTSNIERIEAPSDNQRPEWLNQLQDSLLTHESGMELKPSMDKVLGEQSVQIPIEATAFNGQLTQLWQAPQEINHQDVSLLQLSEEGLSLIENGDDLLSQDQGGFSQSGSKEFEFAQNLGGNAAKITATESAAKTWDMELQNPQIQRIRQDIINRADMLIKEGGGSIKIDLGHEELGKIDLAIEIKDQKIDMRIIAGTEKAREMLAQELPRLREALQAHELDLQSVEIGLRQESSWSQSFDDGSQRQGEAWREEQIGGPWQVTRQVTRERSWTPQASRIHHNGQIQVRV
ncbi:MAG: flagellar hook-length control protein FliK [Oligoflexus sp.]